MSNLFVSEMPSTPDACTSIIDYGGFDDVPGLDTGDGFVYERPTLQVRVRGAKGSFVQADGLARRIKQALHGRRNVTVGLSRYISILAQGNVSFVGYDESRRPLFVVSFRADRTALPDTPGSDSAPYMMPRGRRGEGEDEE